ncbi:hypothetical protein [Paenibacillus sp. YN15]|uniref:hypothetical protein n=1 Tax=Paenibacillus sp. YN15 TaxID=1742774 RepID=UPI000DCE8FC9|nr:hypothetical protein [Paenibacillus sp. YN15]RAU96854.1 hypothetical protein DQG13_20090 [Paenibacillus sp. YN15]
MAVKGNKKKAEGLLLEARQNFELAANAQAEEELIISAHIPEEEKAEDNDQILFADFMLDWLEIVRPSIELTNYISYSNSVKGRIVPYFKEKGITFRIFTNMPIPNGR